jgi:glycerol-3-phosphate dehydrogenase
VLGQASKAADLGRHFGWNLTEREVEWLRANEFAETAEDILWRRSKIGLRLTGDEVAALTAWLKDNPLCAERQGSQASTAAEGSQAGRRTVS